MKVPAARAGHRRDQILTEARRLFRQRGFHGVGIDEIGTAVGITGPGIYRHFASKEDLLTSALLEGAEQLWTERRHADDDEADLDALVHDHAAWAVENVDVIDLWNREARSLPGPARLQQRRIQRRYVEAWVDALLLERPGMPEGQARAMVHAAIGLIHSVAHYDSMLDPEVLRTLLAEMALGALRV